MVNRLSAPSLGLLLVAGLVGCGNARPAVTAPTVQRLYGDQIVFDADTNGVIAFGGKGRTPGQVAPSATLWRWTADRWTPVTAPVAPPARSAALLAADPRSHALLLYGGSTETVVIPSCPPSQADQSGQAACVGAVSPHRELSDTWRFANRSWKRLASDGSVPQAGRLLATDPSLGTFVLVGHTLANVASVQDTPGTWKWTGRSWSLLSPTAPDGASSLAYDPVSHRLLAYGGQQPIKAAPGMGMANSPGYSRTWTFTGKRWAELRPPTTPDPASGVLTATPDGTRLLLINTSGQTWTWTGQTWQRQPTHGAPTGGHFQWSTPLSAAADPSHDQVVLLAADSNGNDQTWTLHAGTWTRHPGTP